MPLIERDALFTFMDVAGNKSQCMVSKTLMKLRQLKLLGFNVVHVSCRKVPKFSDGRKLCCNKPKI